MNKKILLGLSIIGLMLFSGCNSLYWNEKTTTECVKDKWIKSVGQSGQKYMVGMEEGEVYQITDSILKWRFNSADIYNQMDENKCYDLTYFGFRSGFLSTHKVIYEIEEIN